MRYRSGFGYGPGFGWGGWGWRAGGPYGWRPRWGWRIPRYGRGSEPWEPEMPLTKEEAAAHYERHLKLLEEELDQVKRRLSELRG